MNKPIGDSRVTVSLTWKQLARLVEGRKVSKLADSPRDTVVTVTSKRK